MKHEKKHTEPARRLAEALADAGMKAQDLVDRTGIPKASVSHYLNGYYILSPKRAKEVAKVLGVNASWLMGHDVAKHYDLSKFDVIIEPHYSEIGDYPERMQAIISYMRQLSPEGLEKLQERAEELTELPKYKKE